MKNMAGIRCKSYSLPGIDGGDISFAETIDRKSIKITARGPSIGLLNAAVLEITAEQFEAMCSFNSHYDGLEVKPSPAAREGAVIVTPRLAQSGDRAEYVEPESDPVDAI